MRKQGKLWDKKKLSRLLPRANFAVELVLQALLVALHWWFWWLVPPLVLLVVENTGIFTLQWSHGIQAYNWVLLQQANHNKFFWVKSQIYQINNCKSDKIGQRCFMELIFTLRKIHRQIFHPFMWRIHRRAHDKWHVDCMGKDKLSTQATKS